VYQKVIIAGNLGGDPELRYTPQGTPVANFSVATNESWTDQSGQQQERTTWFRVTAWRRLAETCSQYLTKGRQVLVEGRMNPDPQTGAPRIWTGNDGVARASYEITALTVKFLGGRGMAAEEGVPTEEEEIPF
jgi:single-strand DNA-binding protein